MDQAKPKWKELATALEFPAHVIAVVDRKHEDDRVHYLLTEWLEGRNEENDSRPQTWNTLIISLRGAKMLKEAKILDDHLDEMLNSGN